MSRLATRLTVCLALAFSAFGVAGVAGAQQGQPQAWDGQTLSQQPSDTQAMFAAAWGANAAAEWAKERSFALIKAESAQRGLPVATTGPGTTVIPDAPFVAADTTVVQLNTTKDNAPLSGDLIDIDQARHLLYVGNGANDAVEVYDVSSPTPKWLKAFHVPGGSSGIVIATDIQKVFAGTPNGMAIIDANPNSPTYGTTFNTIYLGQGGTDEMDYDPVDHKVYVTDVSDHTVASVDAIHNSLIKAFTNLPDDQIEQPRYDPADGMMYVNFRATSVLAKFDPHNDTMVNMTPIGVPCNPSGIAIKPSTNMALLGCRLNTGNPGMVFWNLTTNTLDHTIPQVSGVDQVIYNAHADRFFVASSRWHRGAETGVLDGSGHFITGVPTTFASHQVGYDQTNGVVYTLGGGLVYFGLPL